LSDPIDQQRAGCRERRARLREVIQFSGCFCGQWLYRQQAIA
jgi:hypothetical protein